MAYRSQLRKLFTNEEVQTALEEAGDGNYKEAAALLTGLGRGYVGRQNVRYWASHLNLKKRNGEPYIGTTVLDRKIRESMTLRERTKADDACQLAHNNTDTSKILVFGDMHCWS